MSEYTAVSANQLKICVETNCPRGGDSGHGGVTVVELRDESSTDMQVEILDDPFGRGAVRIRFGGDTECKTLVECLFWAAAELAQQYRINQWSHDGEVRRHPLGPNPQVRPENVTMVVHSLGTLLEGLEGKGVTKEEMLKALLQSYTFGRQADRYTEVEMLAEVSEELRRL